MENRVKSITANNSTRITSIAPLTQTTQETAGRRTYTTVSNEVHVTPEVYERLAEKLLELLDDEQPDYLRDIAIEVEVNGCCYVLSGSFIVYWEMFDAPDGAFLEFKNIIPVWWELKAYVHFGFFDDEPDTECPTDAQFNDFKKYLIY